MNAIFQFLKINLDIFHAKYYQNVWTFYLLRMHVTLWIYIRLLHWTNEIILKRKNYRLIIYFIDNYQHIICQRTKYFT